MPYAVVVDWFGPFRTVAAARKAFKREELDEVLYIATGTVGLETEPRLQYVGITSNFTRRMNTKHTIRKFVTDESLSIYIGVVNSHAISGRKARHHHPKFSISVDLAETAIAFFLQLPLNSAKRCSRPKESIVLVNRWWKKDYETRKKRPPYSDWPFYIEYDGASDIGIVARYGQEPERVNGKMMNAMRVKASADLKARRLKIE